MKKLLSILLILFLFISIVQIGLFSLSAQAEIYNNEIYNNMVYSGNSDGITIYMCDKNTVGEVVIPSQINGTNVNKIAFEAFKDCKKITNVVIPETVVEIGAFAFSGCVKLQNISLSENLEKIGIRAFENCYNLTDITIPESVSTIEDKYLGSFHCPEIFYGCVNLKAVSISLKPLNKFDLSNDYYYHMRDLFDSSCDKLPDEYSPETITITSGGYINKYVFSGFRTKELILPSTIKIIKEGAFKDYRGENLVLPSSLEKIEEGAFSPGYDGAFSYAQIGYLTIPDSLNSIGSNSGAFGSSSSKLAVNKLRFFSKSQMNIYRQFITVIGGDEDVICWCEKEHIFNSENRKCQRCEYTRPTAPTAVKINSRSIILDSSTGNTRYSYSIDGIYWQSKCIFENLKPNTEYTFYRRLKNAEEGYPEASSLGKKVKTNPEYSITFKDYDGSIISVKNDYIYGDTIDVPPDPSRKDDSIYFYKFSGWDKEVGTVVDDAIYTATYIQTYIDYTIIFKNWNGSVLSTNTYHYGDNVIAPTNPVKLADNTYTYSFSGWDSNITVCNGDKVYTATYTPNYIDYTVIFKNYDGSTLSSKTYHYGDTVIEPNIPSKPENDEYTYTFAGWDNNVVVCSGNKTYTATFDSVKKYVVGDVDGIEGVTDADAVYLLMHTFFPEDYPVNQDCDFNGDQVVTDADAVYLLMYTFFPEDYPLH